MMSLPGTIVLRPNRLRKPELQRDLQLPMSARGCPAKNHHRRFHGTAPWVEGHGWIVVVAYVVGLLAMLALLGWKPDLPH